MSQFLRDFLPTLSELFGEVKFHAEIIKGHTSIKNVEGAIKLVLLTSSNHVIYLYNFFAKISQTVSEFVSRQT